MNTQPTDQPELIFVTANPEKFAMAQALCAKNGVTLQQVVADIDEIQGEDSEKIARDKARRAYEAVGKPVIIGDDSWEFAGLNGFPGPYMKSVSGWLTTQDFLNLTRDKTDRGVTLVQYLVYQDEVETVLFRKDIHGSLITEARGKSRNPHDSIVTLDSDDGRTVAEIYEAGEAHSPDRLLKHPEAWNDVIAWFKAKHNL